MDKINNFNENLIQKDNYKKLADKLNEVIEKCSKKNLTKIYQKNDFNILVKNAKLIEQYTLSDKLNVYILFNENYELISVWMSSNPMLKKENNNSSYCYSGAAGIEFTNGGEGNSVSMWNNFYNSEQIGLIGNFCGQITKIANTTPLQNGGYRLDFNNVGNYFDRSFSWKSKTDYEKNCDLENYVLNYNLTDSEFLNSIKDCFNEINKITKKKTDRKGLLKNLLNKFTDNNSKIKNSGGRTI